MSKQPIKFDADASRRVDRIYQNPDIIAQRKFTLGHLDLNKGDHVLDIGCGPGLLALDMAEAVGPQGSVTGVDPSSDMRAIAKTRCDKVGNITIMDGDAVALPCEDVSLDAVIATQVYEFVPDIEAALTEANRVLKPGGRIAVLDTDWDTALIRTNNRDRMHAVFQSRRDYFVHPDLPTLLPGLLKKAGLALTYAGGTPIVNTSMAHGTYSEEVLRSTAKFAVKRKDLTPEMADAWLAEQDAFDAAGEFFFSVTRFLFIAEKPG